VRASTKDSSQIAEALYRFVSCGDAQVKLIESSTRADELPEFRSLGMNIVYLQWNESWVNADTSIRQLLTSAFPRTPWGEASAYDLIFSADRYPDGMYKVDHPRTVLQRSRAFLKEYPISRYKFDAEHLLAFALKDLWDLSLESNGNFLTSDERANAESTRTQAIKYFEDVFKHRRRLINEPWKEVDDTILTRLRNRQDTGIGYFLNVD